MPHSLPSGSEPSCLLPAIDLGVSLRVRVDGARPKTYLLKDMQQRIQSIPLHKLRARRALAQRKQPQPSHLHLRQQWHISQFKFNPKNCKVNSQLHQ